MAPIRQCPVTYSAKKVFTPTTMRKQCSVMTISLNITLCFKNVFMNSKNLIFMFVCGGLIYGKTKVVLQNKGKRFSLHAQDYFVKILFCR